MENGKRPLIFYRFFIFPLRPLQVPIANRTGLQYNLANASI